ncbi:MAG: TonB-dependent receptor [Myxococcales bacterium]|nr:TonB-dependent receptor [Myxococcales bacterium]
MKVLRSTSGSAAMALGLLLVLSTRALAQDPPEPDTAAPDGDASSDEVGTRETDQEDEASAPAPDDTQASDPAGLPGGVSTEGSVERSADGQAAGGDALASPDGVTTPGSFAPEQAATAEPTAEASEAEAEIEEIVVTAQRFEQSEFETPVSVDAFSQRSLSQRAIVNLRDLSKFSPNLELHSTNRPAGGSSAYAAYIRGVGTGDYQFPTDPGVGLYVDDVYVARTVGALISMDPDLHQIEVIKGPQGTLFGRNTIGGAFNIQTRAPRLVGGTSGTVLLRAGTYGRRDYAVYVNTPLWEDAVGFKLMLAGLHSDGWGQQLPTGQRTFNEGRFVARTGALFRLSSELDVRVDADYARQDQNPPNGRLLGVAPGGPTADRVNRYNANVAPVLNPGLGLEDGSIYDGRWVSPSAYDNHAQQQVFDRYDLGGAGLRVMWSPSDTVQLKSITAARAVKSDVAVDADQTPYPIRSVRTQLEDLQLSQELQLGGTLWSQRLRYLVGLYALREKGHSTVDTKSFDGLFEFDPMAMPRDAANTLVRFDLTSTSLAAFTQESIEPLPDLRITAGARFNHDRKEYRFRSSFTQVDGDRVPQTDAEASWNSFTPKVAVQYTLLDSMMFYGSVAQGFKSGGFGPSNNPLVPTPQYDPETVTSYELGMKSEWFTGRRLTLQLAGFVNDYRNIQLTVQAADEETGELVRTTQNSGEAVIKGMEAEMQAVPVRGLRLNAGFGYVDATFDELTDDAIMTGFEVGDRVPQIPQWSLNTGLQYTLELGFGDLTLRGDVSAKGDQFLTAADETSYQDAYAIYSGRLSFVPARWPGLTLSLYGVNLADTVVYIYRATLPPTGQEIAIAAQPRLIFAAAEYNY